MELNWKGRKGTMHIPLLSQTTVQRQFKHKQELIKLDLSAENEESIGKMREAKANV